MQKRQFGLKNKQCKEDSFNVRGQPKNYHYGSYVELKVENIALPVGASVSSPPTGSGSQSSF